MGNLRRIKSEGFNEFHQNRLDEKKLLAEKKLQEEKRIIKERKRQEEINEIAERFRYNWKEEFLDNFEECEPVVWEPIDKNQNKITRLLEVTKERAIVSGKNTSEINEGMTTSGLFNLTLDAQGDTDIETISGGNSNFTSSFDGQSLESGSGSGSQGGFNVGPGGYAAFNGEVQQSLQFTQRDYVTSSQDTRYVDTVSVQAIGGNYSNGGNYPASPLYVYWITDTGSGLLGTIDNASSIFNLTKYSFTLPPAARTEKTYIWCSEQAAPWSVYNGKTITDVIPTTMEYNAAFYFHKAYIECGGTFPDTYGSPGGPEAYSPMISCWAHLNRTWSGNPNWGGQNANIGIDESYPTPVSNETRSMIFDDAKAIFNSLKSQFSGIIGTNPLTWGISNIGLQRRTPMNVFVPLDSPEATAFIRTDPIMQGLSPQQRYKKLLEMLDAGDEYLLKALGIQGSKARPVEVQMPQSWEQAAGLPQPGDPDYSHNANYNTVSQAEFDKMYWDKVNAGEMGNNSMRNSLRPSWAAPPDPAKTNNRSSSSSSGPSYMNIQVGDQQYISKDGKVQTDTTRGIKDGEMDGKPIYYDDQGNMRVSQPESQPQSDYNPTVYNPEIDGGYTHLDWLYGGPEERARIENIWKTRNQNASSSNTKSNAPPAQNYQKPTPMFDKYGRRTDTGELERGMKTTDPVGDLATLGAAAALTKSGLGGVVSQGISGLRAADKIKQAFKPKPSGPTKAKYQSTPKPKPKTKDSRYRIDEPLNPRGTNNRPPSYSRGRGMGDRWEGPLRNSYEPNGELISEKKKLKSPKDVIANKIPGYYDGKPAPLGFPMEPPAKMINGFHADLVTSDGQKKQSDRYNALDPTSAKAMPPTGNPHIDKKVKAAAKKPK